MAPDFWKSRGVPDPPEGLSKPQRKRWRHQYLEKIKNGTAAPSSSGESGANNDIGKTPSNHPGRSASNGRHGQVAAPPVIPSPSAHKTTSHGSGSQQSVGAQNKVKTGRIVKASHNQNRKEITNGALQTHAEQAKARAALFKAASTTRLCQPPMKRWYNADGTPYRGASSQGSEVDGGTENEPSSSSPQSRPALMSTSGAGMKSDVPLIVTAGRHHSRSMPPPKAAARVIRTPHSTSRVIYPPAGERRLSSIPDRPFIDPKASMQHLIDIQQAQDSDDSSDSDSSDSDVEITPKPEVRGSVSESFAEQIRGSSPESSSNPSPGEQLKTTLHDNIVLSQRGSSADAKDLVEATGGLPTIHTVTSTEGQETESHAELPFNAFGNNHARFNGVIDNFPEETVVQSSSPTRPAIASSVLDYDEPMDIVYNAVEDVTHGILTTTRSLPSSKPPSIRDSQDSPGLTANSRNPVVAMGTSAIASPGRENATQSPGLEEKLDRMLVTTGILTETGARDDDDYDNIVVASKFVNEQAGYSLMNMEEEQGLEKSALGVGNKVTDLRFSPTTSEQAVHDSVQQYFIRKPARAASSRLSASQKQTSSLAAANAPVTENEAGCSVEEVVDAVVSAEPAPAKKRKMTGMTSKHFSTSKRTRRSAAKLESENFTDAADADDENVTPIVELVERRNYPPRRTRTRGLSSPLEVGVDDANEVQVSSVKLESAPADEVDGEGDDIIIVHSQPLSNPQAAAQTSTSTQRRNSASKVKDKASSAEPAVENESAPLPAVHGTFDSATQSQVAPETAIRTAPRTRKSKAASSISNLKTQHETGPTTTTSESLDAAPTPKKTPITRRRLKSTGAVSPHFITDRVDLYNTTSGGKRVPAGTSVVPVPPISEIAFGIIQEKLWHDPFWLLIAVTFLNKTTGRAAVPIFWKLKKLYPTPAELAAADQKELMLLVHSLGLQNARSKRLIKMAAAWLESPPVVGKRYRTLNYPNKGDGKASNTANVVEEDADDCGGALEIGHIPGCRDYAWDSWRIFCRDVLRGVAEDFNGKGAAEGFIPEWKNVLPGDKELRACLRWMWLREGWIWNHVNGEKRRATVEEMEQAKLGQMKFDDPQEMKFAAQAAGIETSPIKLEENEGELDAPFEEEELEDDNVNMRETPTKPRTKVGAEAETPKMNVADDDELRQWPTASSSTSSLTVISADNIIVAPARKSREDIEPLPREKMKGTPTLANQKLIKSARAKARRRERELKNVTLDYEDVFADEAAGTTEMETARAASKANDTSTSAVRTVGVPKSKERAGRSRLEKENAKLAAEAANFLDGGKAARRRSARISLP
ncbi:unnamed protein product [Zymoseptoria tritici ST99CH_1A5]|uniref:HhH-GPD domain-containing protein n=3 Tax=Zymoseptoria tritici TaxID=1047171 RepID=A0A2H1GPI3_ZYMTR|nr:unnamed protein product [Zymoseptoria tritici ST99CH_1E4]SMR57826.1 unnamed protein product [Zymoseptoria tritici ST99CH_3D1]SMY26261.1 unnamed protein product [Zymoseptoria tritici ST99CH_1A5]